MAWGGGVDGLGRRGGGGSAARKNICLEMKRLRATATINFNFSISSICLTDRIEMFNVLNLILIFVVSKYR